MPASSPAPAQSTIPATETGPATTTPASSPALAQSTIPATETGSADGAGPAAADLSDPLRRGYSALALLQGLTVMLDDTAQQLQAGKLDGARGLDVLAATGGALKAVRAVLDEPPPADALQTAWDEANRQVPQIQDIVSRWSANKISPQEVAGLLKPVQAQATQALAAAESALTQEYGVDPRQLRQVREDALNSLRNTLQATPAPR
jgi:hypothetical protein